MSKKTSKAQAEKSLEEMLPFLPKSLEQESIEILEHNGNWNIYLNSTDARLKESFHKVYKEVRVFWGSRELEHKDDEVLEAVSNEEAAPVEEAAQPTKKTISKKNASSKKKK